jgi:hypothetical protein
VARLLRVSVKLRLKAYLRENCPVIGSWLETIKELSNSRGVSRHKEIFNKIYESNGWGGDESRSGMGSSLGETETVRKELPCLLSRLGVITLMDAPCGDFHWLKQVDLEGQHYIGIDIVEKVIRKNRELYGNSKRTFLTKDISRDKLPKVDLIFCRDCLGHLSFMDAHSVLKNFKRTRSTYLLISTFPEFEHNVDIQTGAWRPLNLQVDPFFFSKPLVLISEKCSEDDGRFADKSLGLWPITDILRS